MGELRLRYVQLMSYAHWSPGDKDANIEESEAIWDKLINSRVQKVINHLN